MKSYPRRVHIGIDPGLHGAVAAIEGDEIVLLADAPLCADGYDRRRMQLLLHTVKLHTRPWCPRVTIEQQSPRGQGRVSAYTTGMGMGLWLATIDGVGLRPELVEPCDWVREMVPERPRGVRGKANKAYHVDAAAKLFPEAELSGPRGGTRDGRADALLIAEYARRREALGDP